MESLKKQATRYLLLGGKTSISPPTLPLLVCLGNFWSLSIQIPHHHWEALTLHDTLVIHGHICMRVSTSEQQNYYTLHRPSTSFSSFLSFLSGDKNSMSSNSIPLLLMYSTLKGRGSRRGQKLQSSWQENHWSTELVTLSTYHVVGLCQTILCK